MSTPPETVSAPASSPPTGDVFQLASMRRQLAAMEQELEVTKAGSKRKRPLTTITLGRGVAKIVSMFDSIETLIAESDRRLIAGPEDVEDDVDEATQRSRNRSFKSYELLISLVPNLEKVLIDDDLKNISNFISQLQKGANEARGDDNRRIKEESSIWLNDLHQPSVPFSPKHRDDRGMQNDITGRLLCPLEFDWDDESTRTNIRNGAEGHLIHDNMFISCLYPKLLFDVVDVENGFLRSALLVKTYCCIFTSPSSADDIEEDIMEGAVYKKRKGSRQPKATKSNVATLLRMDGKVTPRSIAYAATLLLFNLTNAPQWPPDGIYDGFDYQVFYNFVVDFFEVVEDDETRRRIQELLGWWNRQVFPRQATGKTTSDVAWQKLVAARAVRARGRTLPSHVPAFCA